MKYQIICDPTYSAVEVNLEAGERIVGEAGAMAWMSGNIRTETFDTRRFDGGHETQAADR